MTTGTDRNLRAGSAWYHQPVAWLGIAVFVASLAGCVWLITVSARYADTPLATSDAVFGVPVSAHSAARPPPASSPKSTP